MNDAQTTIRRKRFTGTVISAGKMAQTITVTVDRFPSHPKVGKKIRRSRRYLVHDAESKARVGDVVTIEETRPLSRRKHFRLLEILSSGKVVAQPADSGIAEGSDRVKETP